MPRSLKASRTYVSPEEGVIRKISFTFQSSSSSLTSLYSRIPNSVVLLNRVLALTPEHFTITAYCIPVLRSTSIRSAVMLYFGLPNELLSR